MHIRAEFIGFDADSDPNSIRRTSSIQNCIRRTTEAINKSGILDKIEDRVIKRIKAIIHESQYKENVLLKDELNSFKMQYEKVKKLLFKNYRKVNEIEKKSTQKLKAAERKLKGQENEILKLREKLNEARKNQSSLPQSHERLKDNPKSSEGERKFGRDKNTKKLKCRSCCLDFHTKRELFIHQKNHKDLAIQWNNLSPSVDNWEERQFRCVFCDFSTKIEKYLVKHMERHDGGNKGKFNCIECSYSTDYEGEFLVHLNVHQKDYNELIKCQLCEFADRHSFELIEHMIEVHRLEILRKD